MSKTTPPPKPRCPTCGSVARRLYHRLGNTEPFTPVKDAAECPTCGSYLIEA